MDAPPKKAILFHYLRAPRRPLRATSPSFPYSSSNLSFSLNSSELTHRNGGGGRGEGKGVADIIREVLSDIKEQAITIATPPRVHLHSQTKTQHTQLHRKREKDKQTGTKTGTEIDSEITRNIVRDEASESGQSDLLHEEGEIAVNDLEK